MDKRKHIFTQLEKKTFINLLKAYGNIVENKRTDGASLREKNQAWHTITREYNASSHATTKVTLKQLRRLWMNLKQRQKGALTKERQHRLATRGGPLTSDAGINLDVSQVAPALKDEIEDAIDSDTTPESVEIQLVEKEYRDRKQRANEVHELDILLLKEKIREAKAKADLAKLLLQQQQQLLGHMLKRSTGTE